MVEGNIKITFSSNIIKNRIESNGLVWRSWKVMIRPVCDDLILSNYIDHVEYLLHPSFKNPQIVCTQEPYMIQQEGWGEFDLRIAFHFRDGSLPQTTVFDLHFNRAKYSVYRKLKMKKPSSAKQSKKRQREESFSSASSSSSLLVNTPMDEYNLTSPNLLFHDENDLHNQKQLQQQSILYEPKPKICRSFQQQQTNMSYIPPKETFTRHPTKSNSGNVTENVNLSELTAYLESLDGQDLREIYRIILQYDTRDMTIVETKDEVLLDLCCLCPSLLIELWEFRKRKKRRLSQQVKCKEDSALSSYENGDSNNKFIHNM